MPGGIHSAASGLFAQQARLDALANDLANVNTAGYRKQRLGFRDLPYEGPAGIRVGAGAAVSSAGISQLQGNLLQSDNPLDVAVEGSGYLQVRLADGRVGLSRVGDLRIDSQGSVVTVGGERLVPPLTVPAGTDAKDISIAQDGTVTAGGTRIGTIVLVDVPAPNGLQALGGGRYLPTTASGAPVAATDSKLLQGYLETSNVDIGQAMVEMINAQRSFELASRAVRTQDELLDIANGIRR